MFAVIHETSCSSHLEIVAFYYPSTPDRTASILGLEMSPIPFLLESYRVLSMFSVDCVGIACNTMHYWLNRQKKLKTNPDYFRIPTCNMIEETANRLKLHGVELVGLLATTGTADTGLYQSACSRQGIRVLLPDAAGRGKASLDKKAGRASREIYGRFGIRDNGSSRDGNTKGLIEFLTDSFGEQEGLIMEAVYGEFGVKQGYTSGVAADLFMAAVQRLTKRGTDHIILGCTELPMLAPAGPVRIRGRIVNFIDPNKILAEAMAYRGKRGSRLGIIGGMGPAATIDLLAKMEVDHRAVKFMSEIYAETIRQLNASGRINVKDQDHLEYVFLNTSTSDQYTEALSGLGVSFVCYTDQRNRVAYPATGFEIESDVESIVRRALVGE